MRIPYENILIYEPFYTGHHSEYISHLLAWLTRSVDTDTLPEVHFLLHPLFEAETTQYRHPRIVLHFITAEIPTQNGLWPAFKRSFFEWTLLKKYIVQEDINRLLIMNLDHFQMLLGMVSGKPEALKISGILFLPYSQMPLLPEVLSVKYLKLRLAKWRKSLQIRWMLSNKNMHKVLILNDQNTVNSLNKKHTEKFTYLPDPVFRIRVEPAADTSLNTKYHCSPGRKIYLCFGSIEYRKNVDNLLKAVRLLEPQAQSQLTILVAGNFESDEYFYHLEQVRATLIKECPAVECHFLHRYLTTTEVGELLAMADIIHLAYIDFYGSSGVFGHATHFNKPCLGTKHGLIGQLIPENKMGLVVDPASPVQIAEALHFFLTNPDYRVNGQDFVNRHSPTAFAETIFQILLTP